MATTKKGTTGTTAGSGARKGETKANGMAKQSQSKTSPAAKGAGAPKKAAPVKLNDRQRDFLTRIKGAGVGGYQLGMKSEQRTIDALMERKLVKRGARNKETGSYPYMLTRAGEKHVPAASPPAPMTEPKAMAEPQPMTETMTPS